MKITYIKEGYFKNIDATSVGLFPNTPQPKAPNINISTFKSQLFKKLNITEYNNYEIDVANLRIIFKEENNND